MDFDFGYNLELDFDFDVDNCIIEAGCLISFADSTLIAEDKSSNSP